MQVVSASRLRDTIAEHLRDGMTRRQIENFFEDLGLAPWPNEWFSFTKAAFVWSILQDHTLADLADVARRVMDELDAPKLAALVDRLGPTGVAGDLKNLIFAADGPKPRIVFRDAVNNDLDIVENEQYCLVYDRPLGPNGLTWKELTPTGGQTGKAWPASRRQTSPGAFTAGWICPWTTTPSGESCAPTPNGTCDWAPTSPR